MTLKKPNWRQILAHLCFVVVHQKGNGGELQPLFAGASLAYVSFVSPWFAGLFSQTSPTSFVL